MFFIAGTHDMYKPIPVATSGRSLYSAIRAFAFLNDITVPEAPDLRIDTSVTELADSVASVLAALSEQGLLTERGPA